MTGWSLDAIKSRIGGLQKNSMTERNEVVNLTKNTNRVWTVDDIPC